MPLQTIKISAPSYCTADKAGKLAKCAIVFSIILLLVLGFEDYEELGALLSTESMTDLPSFLSPLAEIIPEGYDSN